MVRIDFVVGVAILIISIAVVFSYIISYLSSFTGLVSTSELKTITFNIYKNFFSGKGIPENWETRNYTPLKLGLMTELYRIPIVINETNGTDRGVMSMNVTIQFDTSCTNKTWNSTVRVYNESYVEVPHHLYNQTFCTQRYLNSSDLVFNTTLSANQNKTFFVYYSGESSIDPANYTISFPEFNSTANVSVQIYPEEVFSILSVSKLNKLRQLNYDDIITIIGTEYKFNLEVRK